MTDFSIRSACPEDASVIVQFQLDMATETEDMSLDRDTVTKGVAAIFDDPHKGGYYVATLDDEVIGCLLTVPEWSDWRNGTVLWIHSVYVLPQFRRQGVFSRMYHHLKTLVESADDLQGLRLFVYRDNSGASDVYAKMGMDNEHYQLYQWMKNG